MKHHYLGPPTLYLLLRSSLVAFRNSCENAASNVNPWSHTLHPLYLHTHYIICTKIYDEILKRDKCNIDALNGKGIALANLAERGLKDKKKDLYRAAIECFDKVIEQYEGKDICRDNDFVYACRNKGVALVKIE